MKTAIKVTMLAALISVPYAMSAQAQTYPDKPINIIVPWPPGAVDVYIRIVQAYAEKELGKPIIVQNKGGANGALGTEMVARAKPDGYTLLFNVTSSAVMAPLTMGNAKFDIQKDFTPITNFFDSPVVLVVRKSLPVKNLDELVAYAKKNQGKMNFGSPGSGSALHLIGESFAEAAGLKMTHVAYKGFSPEVQALISGELDIGFIATGTIRTHVLNGNVRPIAMTSGEAPKDFGTIPDLTKALKGFENIPIFAALWAPAGTPKEIVAKLSRVMIGALKEPKIRNKIAEGGQIPTGHSMEGMAKAVAENVEVSTRLVNKAKAAGVKFQ